MAGGTEGDEVAGELEKLGELEELDELEEMKELEELEEQVCDLYLQHIEGEVGPIGLALQGFHLHGQEVWQRQDHRDNWKYGHH